MAQIKIDISQVVGRGYGAFWECRKRYRVVKGSKASKKSATAALWYIYHLMKFPAANLLVVRGVFNTHLTSTFAQLKWAINRLQVGHLWKATANPLEIRHVDTKQKILFRGFDDVDKIASVTVESGHLCWVWVEEAFEIKSEADFDKLDLSAPRGEVPAPLFKQTTLTFNPWSEKHWLKKRFFDTPRDSVFTTTTNYLCNEFLDEVDREQYETMRTENPRRYQVAGLGNWGVSEGLVYDRWEVEAFDADALRDGPEGWKFLFAYGLDYGYTNDPTAFIALAVNKVDKELYICDEHYEKRMHNDAIAGMLVAKGCAKERIRADSAEPKSNDDLRRLGITRLRAAAKGRDSVMNGISRLQEYRMIVHPRCVNAIAELSSYIWDVKSEGAVNRPVDRDNHLMDAMRYAMEDVAPFRPERGDVRAARAKEARRSQRRSGLGGVRAGDFTGGWG